MDPEEREEEQETVSEDDSPFVDFSLGSFGPFQLLRELGRGGMGIVYLARDRSLDRPLALKMLPHSVADESRMVQRFLRESQAAARLRHRNIIRIFSAGELNGTYYFSMEYVPGVTLQRICVISGSSGSTRRARSRCGE